MQNAEIIRLEDVSLAYVTPSESVRALKHVSLSVGAGEHVAIVGRSGSGKSSLLNLITGLDRPSSGRVVVGGTAVNELAEGKLALWRGRNVGIVFQFFQLLPSLTVAENLGLAMELVGAVPKKERSKRVKELLNLTGILDKSERLPAELSGGEQQRAAIARALVNDPPLLMADEPTGNLDSRNAEIVMGIFGRLVESGKTVVVVTHERSVTEIYDRVITLADGAVAGNLRKSA